MGKGVTKGIQVYVCAANAGANVNWASADGTFYPLNADEHGNLFANLVVDVSGTATPVGGDQIDNDTVPVTTVGLNIKNFNYVYSKTLDVWHRDTGGRADLTNAAFTAGVASTVLSAADAQRSYLLVQNNSAGDMFVQFGAAATLTTGVKIPTGGFYEPLTVPLNSVNVIGSGAGLAGVIVTG